MKNRRDALANIPFCRRSWRFPAALLTIAYVVTFAWGIHLWQEKAQEAEALAVASLANTMEQARQLPEVIDKMGDLMADAMPAGGLTATNVGGLGLRDQTAVVNIAAKSTLPGSGPSQGSLVSVGSGVIVSPNGNVVTAWHLIQDMRDIQVRLLTPQGPRQFSAELVKKMPNRDLAVLKIASLEPFPYLVLEEPPGLQPGEWVSALGSPMGTGWIAGAGVLTEVNASLEVGGRRIGGLIRSTASTHGSQNGGPLLNANGRMIGLNLVIQDGNGQLIGYAVPARSIIHQFHDVVNFPNDRNPMPIQAAAFQTDPATMAPTGSRGMADRWWQQAKSLVEGGNPTPGGGLSDRKPVWVPTAGAAAPAPINRSDDWHLWGYTLETIGGLLLLGLVSGISGGMMTMGGGIIKVSGLMLFFGYGMVLVRPVAYLTNIFLYGAASLRYHRHGLIRWESVRPLIPWAMTGIMLGFFFGIFMGNTMVRYLLAAFAFMVGIKMLTEIIEQQRYGNVFEDEDIEGAEQADITELFLRYLGVRDVPLHRRPRPMHPLVKSGLLGLPLGVISGILGITGGVVEVPLQRYIAGEPLRNAIANSAILVFCASMVGSVVALFYGIQTGAFDWKVPLVLSVFVIPGAYVGGWIGAWLTQVVPVTALRWIYALLMFVITARMIWE